MTEIVQIVQFIKQAEQLKKQLRSGYLSNGQRESVPEHTWRLCLLALTLESKLPGINFAKLIKICIVHDLGEAISGDIPAPEQSTTTTKNDAERRDLELLVESLPQSVRLHILELWDEYSAAKTPEAKIAKALDKIETLIQHNQGENPSDFDYRFNLTYGSKDTVGTPLIESLRELVDADTRRRIHERGSDVP